MGSNLSYTPGKCLKNRRSKSEEHLNSKRNRMNAGVVEDRLKEDWVTGAATRDEFPKKIPFSEEENSTTKGKLDKEIQRRREVAACLAKIAPKINEDSIFEAELSKSSRGLGFSISEMEGFIFIKQLFPLEAASRTGLLQEGDIILSANENTLTGLSAFNALQVLRKVTNPVRLIVCRLQVTKKRCLMSYDTLLNGGDGDFMDGLGIKRWEKRDFQIVMKKDGGSLGFTLRSGEGGRGHVVRALVKEPAISDGRIKPGDRILSVNGVKIYDKSHEETIKFLRDCGETVLLQLRRENLSSSLTSISSHYEMADVDVVDNKTTLRYRKEAVEMLNDLAVKKSKWVEKGKMNNVKENCEKEKPIGLIARRRSRSKNSIFRPKEDLSHPSDSLENFHSNDVGITSITILNDEPISLPTRPDITTKEDKKPFHHLDPAYHSMNIPYFKCDKDWGENHGLQKWKGVVLTAAPVLAAEGCECDDNNEPANTKDTLEKWITVELHKNWNTRLGFSLKSGEVEDEETIVSEIHQDSVAAKDGTLKKGDTIYQVNGKIVRHMSTNQVIELLRNARGIIKIVVRRRPQAMESIPLPF